MTVSDVVDHDVLRTVIERLIGPIRTELRSERNRIFVPEYIRDSNAIRVR